MSMNEYLQPEQLIKIYGGCAKSGTYLFDGAIELIVGLSLLLLYLLGKTGDFAMSLLAFFLTIDKYTKADFIGGHMDKISTNILFIVPLAVLVLAILIIISGILKLISGSQLKNTRIRLFETYIEAEYYKKTLYGLSRRMMSAKYQEIEDIYNKSYTVFIRFNKKKIKIWASDKYAAEKIVSMVKTVKMADDANVLL